MSRLLKTPIESLRAGAATPVIPGISVTEAPMNSTTARQFLRDPGPMNPNVAPGMPSPEAGAYQGARTGPPVPPGGVRPAAAPAQPLGPRVGGALRAVGSGLGAGLAGGFIGEQAAKAATQVGAPGVGGGPAPVSDAVAQIPTDGYQPAPAAQPYNFFKDSEAGRNIGNLANAASMIPGVGTAAKSLRTVAGAGALQGFANGVQNSPTPSTSAVPGSGAVQAATATEDTKPTLRSDFAAPTVPVLNGQVGMSVDGASGVSKFVQDGKTTYSNVPGENAGAMARGGVSVVPGMSQAAIDKVLGGNTAGQQANDNAIMAANLRDGVDINRGTSKDPRNAPGADLEALARSPLGTPGRSFARERLRDLTVADTTKRGQDITARGQDMTAKTAAETAASAATAARTKLAYDMTKDAQTRADQRGDKAFEQREAADKNLTEKFKSMLPTTVDANGKSVVDEAAVAEHKAAATAYVAGGIRRAQAQLQKNPNDQEAKAAIKELEDKGVAALDDKRLQQIIAAQELKKRSQKADGFSPFAGSHVDSADPYDYMIKGKQKGVFQDQDVLNGGSKLPDRYTLREKGGYAWAPNALDNTTRRFDIIRPGLRNE